jgi:hypothetical protein
VIRYNIPATVDIVIDVHNALGQRVARLVDEPRSAGTYEAVMDGSALPSGVYYCTMQAGQFKATKKLVLMK